MNPFQHDLESFNAHEPSFADVEKFFGQYEEFVKARRSDKAHRSGQRAVFLLLNFLVFLGYGFLVVQHASGESILRKFFFLALLGVSLCFLWWQTVKMFYFLYRGKWDSMNDLRRRLQHQALRMRWYWLLARMPLHDDASPEKVAAALPLAFIAIHIVFAGFGVVQLL